MNILVKDRRSYAQILYDNEKHFEDIAKGVLAELLPTFFVVDFKPLVLGEEGIRRRPDLALVDRNYRMWTVVEVELQNHSLEVHVLPQMRALATGSYDQRHAENLADNHPEIDRGRVRRLVATSYPELLVLVNSRTVLDDGWSTLASELTLSLAFLETYRCHHSGEAIFHLSGRIPRIRATRIAGAKKNSWMNWLEIASVDAIPADTGQELRIAFEGNSTYWDVLRTGDRVLLQPKSPVTLRTDRNYEILRDEDGSLALRML